METPHSPEKSVPDNCRNCPVLAKYAQLLDAFSTDEKKYTQGSLVYLDNAADIASNDQESKLVEIYRSIGRSQGESAMHNYVMYQKMKAENEALLTSADPECTGPTRGSGQAHSEYPAIIKALDYITGVKSCNNAGFANVADEPEIRTKLITNNWVAPDKNENQ